MSSVFVRAGHETGNGGDTHLSRYLLAQHIAEVTLKRVTIQKLEKIFTEKTTLQTIKDNIAEWPNTISKMKFTIVKEMLYEDGHEKAALNEENSHQVKISNAYFEKYKMGLEEVIVNVIHESGHKLGISDHSELDKIGTVLVNHVYKYTMQDNSWQKYLKGDKSIQSALDKRLRDVALEYVHKGQGLYLAKFLYLFTKFNLRNSNLSQMFKYLTLANFQIDIKEWFPATDNPSYWDFDDHFYHRMNKELVIFARTLSKEESLSLVKYGMAKLKAYGLFYSENNYEFDKLAEEINAILLNKNEPVNYSIGHLRIKINDNFFIRF
jgi:hypothetical protein